MIFFLLRLDVDDIDQRYASKKSKNALMDPESDEDLSIFNK